MVHFLPAHQASAFSTAQFTTSYLWGLLTDKFGRKPIVVIANAVMGLATLCLGLAPSYPFAVAARAIGGAANGSGVAIKTMLAESCDATTQAKGRNPPSACISACRTTADNARDSLPCGHAHA